MSASPPAIADVIDIQAVQSLMDDFYDLVRVPMSLIDVEGHVLVGVGWQDICTQFHRQHADASRVCVESDTQLTAGIRPGEFRLYKCPHHLWDVATPVVVGGRHVANVFSGQFFFDDERVDYELFRGQARYYGFDERAYIDALDRVPRLGRARLDRAVAFFVRLAQMVSRIGESKARLARTVQERDALIQSREEAALGAQRERQLLTTVVQATDVMFAYLDADFNFIMVNPAYAGTCGMTPEEMVGQNHFALFPHAENEAIFRRVRDTGEAVFYRDKPFEFPDQPERGTTYWDWSLVPVKDAGPVTGLVFSLRETTKFVRTAEALRLTERNASALADAATESIWMFAPDGRVLFANKTAAARLGMTPRQIEGSVAWDHLPPHLVDSRRTYLEQVLQTGTTVRFEDERAGVRFRHSFYPVVEDGRVVAVSAFSQDITDRRRAEESLEAANMRLLEADRRKDEFIAILSHELRNPLAPIRFALPVLQSQAMDDNGRRALAAIGRQTDHLTRLVDDLLDVSRITSGKIELRRQHVELDSLLPQAVEAASPAIVAGRHTLRLSTDDAEALWLNADPQRVAQVITNLLDNSAKYTPPGGDIWLETRRDGDYAVVSVRDTGSGIPGDALTSVFEMFRQVRRDDRPQGGLGVGLAVVKRLVEMHEGTIEARSAGVGRGAEFVVRLPLVGNLRPAANEPSGSDVETRPGRLRVLVVDDNEDLAEMLALVIETEGHDVWTALDGRTAVTAAVSIRPDVVLLDLGLPGMDGFEVARELRRHPQLASTWLVALTGWGQAEDRKRTSEVGFHYHLTKPADPDALRRLLAGFCPRP